MQTESRISSLLEYYAEVKLIFCKYTTVFPIFQCFLLLSLSIIML